MRWFAALFWGWVIYLMASTAFSNLKPKVPVSALRGFLVEEVVTRAVFDPLWEYFFGTKGNMLSDDEKSGFASVVADKVIESIIPSAHAGDTLTCDWRLSEQECYRMVTAHGNSLLSVYSDPMMKAFMQCRSEVVRGKTTSALDYTKQVDAITSCVSSAGYQREILAVLEAVKGRGVRK